jgi:hypothetical protein
MRRLGPADILDLAEAGTGPATGALAILARADVDDVQAHKALSVGARDARLMAVRTQTFGARVELVSRCPNCATKVEFAVAATDVGLDSEPPPSGGSAQRLAGRDYRLRPVCAGDLAAIEALDDVEAARRALLARCVEALEGTADAPPAEVEETLEAALEALDPQAEVLLDLACPACRARWSEVFDAAHVLAADIQAAARRLTSEVAALARVYHWSERDILAMPAARRRFYLEAAG